MNSIPIIYENDEILVINKACGLAVQGGKNVTASVDVVLSKQCGYKVFLVHRLDKDTAGLLIVAKSAQAATKWTNIIASKQIVKEYEAICFGEFSEQKGVFLTSVEHKGIAKDARTQFEVVKTGAIKDTGQFFSLVKLQLETGRMHQIRIHLAQNGTPIAGDDKYGNFKLNKQMRKTIGIKKLHLAAVCLIFSDQKIKIPLPMHMLKTLTLLD